MPAIIRCPKCDRMLSSQAQTEGWLSCPHCEGSVFVTAEQAAWPNPQLPGEAAPADAEAHALVAEDEVDVTGAHSRLGQAMPWLMSISINAAVILALTFVSLFTVTPPGRDIPLAGFMTVDDSTPMRPQDDTEIPTPPTERPPLRPTYQPKGPEAPTIGGHDDDTPIDQIGLLGSHGPAIGIGIGGRRGPSSNMFPPSGPSSGSVANTVFVIDRSGSMESTFAIVRRELLKRIARMDARSKFHIVMFADEAPIENPPGRLVKATDSNKDRVADFLDGIVAQGRTRPGPALEVAFRDLAGANDGGKQIYLLTDAAFPDDASVLDVID